MKKNTRLHAGILATAVPAALTAYAATSTTGEVATLRAQASIAATGASSAAPAASRPTVPLGTPPAQARINLETTLAIVRSAQTGKAVRLPLET